MAAQGVEIDRLTLAGWVGQTSVLLDPIVSRIREVGLTASKIHTDDTPVPMLDPGRDKTAAGRLWAYAVDDRGSGPTTPSLAWYEFTTDLLERIGELYEMEAEVRGQQPEIRRQTQWPRTTGPAQYAC